MTRFILGWPWNWPMKLMVVLMSANVAVGLWRGEWQHLLFNLSGACMGRALWEYMNRDEEQ